MNKKFGGKKKKGNNCSFKHVLINIFINALLLKKNKLGSWKFCAPDHVWINSYNKFFFLFSFVFVQLIIKYLYSCWLEKCEQECSLWNFHTHWTSTLCSCGFKFLCASLLSDHHETGTFYRKILSLILYKQFMRFWFSVVEISFANISSCAISQRRVVAVNVKPALSHPFTLRPDKLTLVCLFTFSTHHINKPMRNEP